MKEKLLDLLEYTCHSNREMIEAITEHQAGVPEKIIRLISHTLNAQQIWNSRISGEDSFDVWHIHPPEDLQTINAQNFSKSKEILGKSDPDRSIRYCNSQGTAFENTVFEMLFQVVNHATYHRGQINSMLKETGREPLLTDYIFYKRKKGPAFPEL